MLLTVKRVNKLEQMIGRSDWIDINLCQWLMNPIALTIISVLILNILYIILINIITSFKWYSIYLVEANVAFHNISSTETVSL